MGRGYFSATFENRASAAAQIAESDEEVIKRLMPMDESFESDCSFVAGLELRRGNLFATGLD